jgi:hypothetical protein
MLHLELPHINVLSKIDLLTQYGDLGILLFSLKRTENLTESNSYLFFFTDFNLDYYTEVQDLSYLEDALSSASPRYRALNMAICELIEDFSLVGFETLAVEVRVVFSLPHGKASSSQLTKPHRTNTRC